MPFVRSLVAVTGAALIATLAACGDISAPVTPPVTPPVVPPVPVPAPAPVLSAADSQAARTAWAFVANNSQPATGLSKPIAAFQYLTVWDIGSQLAATWSAHELGVLDHASYDTRMRQLLATLNTLPLFEGSAFNKTYDAVTGQMVDRNRAPSAVGYGWSATDLGRLLVWLRIVAVSQPQFADQARAVMSRIDVSQVIRGGTFQGVDVDPNAGGRRSYAETGLGYEQYAAAGFALWGKRATNALDASANVRDVDVYGVAVSIDARGKGRLTSEPYLVMGLETGWYNATLRDQATRVLAAQQARYDQTHVLTMVSEDALPVAPYYFYYYSVYSDGRSFVVDGPDEGTFVTDPRWVSTKAAFAWAALLPSAYTRTALDAVQGAAIPGQGWGAGVYESTLAPTGEASLNTSAVVLESLAYRARGRAFLDEKI
jgi:hypothetical protein